MNLARSVKSGGYVWLAAPASNRAHGSPGYFSAGLTPEYLSLNLEKYGFEVIAQGSLGSRRLYRAIHTMPTWLSYRAHQLPFIFGFDDLPRKYRYFFKVRYWFRLFELVFFSGKLSSCIETATESWCFARKVETENGPVSKRF